MQIVQPKCKKGHKVRRKYKNNRLGSKLKKTRDVKNNICKVND